VEIFVVGERGEPFIPDKPAASTDGIVASMEMSAPSTGIISCQDLSPKTVQAIDRILGRASTSDRR